jgi:hypothetical protein
VSVKEKYVKNGKCETIIAPLKNMKKLYIMHDKEGKDELHSPTKNRSFYFRKLNSTLFHGFSAAK